MQMPKSVTKEKEEVGTVGTEAEIPLQPGEVHRTADMHPAAHGGLHAIAGWYATKEAASHGEPIHNQAPGSCGRPMLLHSHFRGLQLSERTHAVSALEELQLVRRSHMGEVSEWLYPMGYTAHWSRWRAQSGKGQVLWKYCDVHSQLPCITQGEEVEELGR